MHCSLLGAFLGTRGHDLALLLGHFAAMWGTRGHALVMHRGRSRGVPQGLEARLGLATWPFQGDVGDSGACIGHAPGPFWWPSLGPGASLNRASGPFRGVLWDSGGMP